MNGLLLAINAGSSSVKFSLFYVASGIPSLEMAGQVEGIGSAARLVVRSADGDVLRDTRWGREANQRGVADYDACLGWLLGWIDKQTDGTPIVGVGHRVVHGALRYAAPVRVDAAVLADLRALVPLAPLHQPHNLEPIERLARLRPDIPQVACFDTAFHQGHAGTIDRLPLPRALHDEGIRRYGFHGLSYEYVAGRLGAVAPEIARGRVVVAHLGNGASLCALRDGRSVATTMGFTALDGLMMGTRCGSIDPGIVLYLLQQRRMDAAGVERLLYHESGLKGVSGLGHDMRMLLSSRDPRAAEAIELFVQRVVQETGGMAALLGGLDGLVFTAGIGEHAAPIRAKVVTRLAWLGLDLDADANARHGPRLTRPGARISAYVVPTDEELMVARHTIDALAPADGQ